jgi:hypothetical protein
MNIPRAIGIRMINTNTKENMKTINGIFNLVFSLEEYFQVNQNIPADATQHESQKNKKWRKGDIHRDLKHIRLFETHKNDIVVTGI